MSTKEDLTVKIFSSMFGASLGETLTYPICTLKTVYQTSNNNLPLSILTQDLLKSRSIKGLYQGCQWAVISQMTAISSKYTAYEVIKSYRGTQQSDLMNNAINGCLGGFIGNFVSHPFDVIKNLFCLGFIERRIQDMAYSFLGRNTINGIYLVFHKCNKRRNYDGSSF